MMGGRYPSLQVLKKPVREAVVVLAILAHSVTELTSTVTFLWEVFPSAYNSSASESETLVVVEMDLVYDR